jgi:small subunit ribosomal protein S6
MRLYETAFLIAPNLPEEEIEKLIEEMAGVVSKKKGKMDNIDKWGKRRLAYPVNKFTEAYYVFFHYQGEPEVPAELERRFKQMEQVLRYMTLKKDQKENVRKKKKDKPKKEEPPAREKPAEIIPGTETPAPVEKTSEEE